LNSLDVFNASIFKNHPPHSLYKKVAWYENLGIQLKAWNHAQFMMRKKILGNKTPNLGLFPE
jgi:hypothetical protein